MVDRKTASYIKEMKEYANINHVPIMLDDGISYLIEFLVQHQISTVLELGTAIGYSAIMMALALPQLKITTIERDRERYLEAVKNIKKFGLEDRITLIFSDAFNVELHDKFDLIFLDAAKGQNIKFFNQFDKNLKPGGFYITDNIEFHGLVKKDDSEIRSKNMRSLIHKIKDYIQFLENHPNYHTEFVAVGDGLAVSEKK